MYIFGMHFMIPLMNKEGVGAFGLWVIKAPAISQMISGDIWFKGRRK